MQVIYKQWRAYFLLQVKSRRNQDHLLFFFFTSTVSC